MRCYFDRTLSTVWASGHKSNLPLPFDRELSQELHASIVPIPAAPGDCIIFTYACKRLSNDLREGARFKRRWCSYLELRLKSRYNSMRLQGGDDAWHVTLDVHRPRPNDTLLQVLVVTATPVAISLLAFWPHLTMCSCMLQTTPTAQRGAQIYSTSRSSRIMKT
eukprot:SAG31_NODE_182_length_21094_cov_4.426721_2_plen_164_part_00